MCLQPRHSEFISESHPVTSSDSWMRQQQRIVSRCNLEYKTRSRYKIVFHYVPINSTRTDSWTLLSHRVILRCDSSKELYRDVICKSKLVLDTKLLSTLFQSIPLELTVELYCHIEWFLDAKAAKESYRDVICNSTPVLDTKLLSTLFQSIPLELTVELLKNNSKK